MGLDPFYLNRGGLATYGVDDVATVWTYLGVATEDHPYGGRVRARS
jgi:hypothetical protein